MAIRRMAYQSYNIDGGNIGVSLNRNAREENSNKMASYDNKL